jgi:hypothetical protein
MEKYRVTKIIAYVLLVAAVVFFLAGLIWALSLGSSGLGQGWGVGWRGWIQIPILVGALGTAISLLVLGSVLLFLVEIDNNLAVARQKREASSVQPAGVDTTRPAAS